MKLAELLDKEIADKCIERIYEQLIAKKESCDLVDIQRGESPETIQLGSNDTSC